MSFKHNRLSLELIECNKTGILSQAAIDIVDPIARDNFLQTVVHEWKATVEQQEAMHRVGMDRFKKEWNNPNQYINHWNPGSIAFTLYSDGLMSYINEHKKLV